VNALQLRFEAPSDFQGVVRAIHPNTGELLAAKHVTIIVYGSPAPQGSKSFKGTFVDKTGRTRGIMAESSKKVKPWRSDVKEAALLVRNGAEPLDGPLLVRMVFTIPKPLSASKSRRTWAMRRPDVSKLARSTEDALTDAGIWVDDARIVEYSRLAKVFPGEDAEALESPGVRIEIAVLA
jgi:crossover junction endodeoxyribonuclease RusA